MPLLCVLPHAMETLLTAALRDGWLTCFASLPSSELPKDRAMLNLTRIFSIYHSNWSIKKDFDKWFWMSKWLRQEQSGNDFFKKRKQFLFLRSPTFSATVVFPTCTSLCIAPCCSLLPSYNKKNIIWIHSVIISDNVNVMLSTFTNTIKNYSKNSLLLLINSHTRNFL